MDSWDLRIDIVKIKIY